MSTEDSSENTDDSPECMHNFVYFDSGLHNGIEIYARPYNSKYNLYKDGQYGFVLHRSKNGKCSVVGFDDQQGYVMDIPSDMMSRVKYLGLPLHKNMRKFERLSDRP